MKIVVYKGFDNEFLKAQIIEPLLNNNYEDKSNYLKLDDNYKNQIMMAVLSNINMDKEFFITYEEFELAYDHIILFSAQNSLSIRIINNNIYVGLYPLNVSISNELYNKYQGKIDLLINNAGFGLFGLFSETDLDRELEMIDLNIKAYHVLTKLFLQDFKKRDSGYILNVCSSAGFMAGPRLSTYYATKNYVTKLTMAINEELRHDKSNVVVCALCPGPVNTNFNKVAHGEFSLKEVSPKFVSEYAIKQMFKKKMIIVPSLSIKLGLFMLRFIPYRWQLNIIYHVQGIKLN